MKYSHFIFGKGLITIEINLLGCYLGQRANYLRQTIFEFLTLFTCNEPIYNWEGHF